MYNHFDSEIHSIIHNKPYPPKENVTNEGYSLLIPNKTIQLKVNDFDPWMELFCSNFWKKTNVIIQHISKQMDIISDEKEWFYFDSTIHKKIKKSNVLIKRMKFIQARKRDTAVYLCLQIAKKGMYHANYLFYDSHIDCWIRSDPRCPVQSAPGIYLDKILTKYFGNKNYKSPDIMMPGLQFLYPKKGWCIIFATMMLELYV